jgi:hypothetical protein
VVKRSTYHKFDDDDTEMLVNRSAQAYACPGKPFEHCMIGCVDDEFNM